MTAFRRLVPVLAVYLPLAAAAFPALAQTPPAGQKFVDRFNAANTTHDGKLTLAQAQAGQMRAIVKNFDQIDQAHRGFVTVPDIRAYRRRVRDQRELQQNPPAGPTP